MLQTRLTGNYCTHYATCKNTNFLIYSCFFCVYEGVHACARMHVYLQCSFCSVFIVDTFLASRKIVPETTSPLRLFINRGSLRASLPPGLCSLWLWSCCQSVGEFSPTRHLKSRSVPSPLEHVSLLPLPLSLLLRL